MIKRLLWMVTLPLLAIGGTFVEAQQPGKIPRIGYLSSGSPSATTPEFREAFRRSENVKPWLLVFRAENHGHTVVYGFD